MLFVHKVAVWFNIPVNSGCNCLFSFASSLAGNKNGEICISQSHDESNQYIDGIVVTMAMKKGRIKVGPFIMWVPLVAMGLTPGVWLHGNRQFTAKEQFPPGVQQVSNQDGLGKTFSLFLHSAMRLCASSIICPR